MSARIPCLTRVGENVKKYKFIDLDDKDEVTIGRNPDVTMCILSTMISRCHAVLNKTKENGWTIRDNKSLNGVFVNNEKLEPQKPRELKDGDLVQFGVRTDPEVAPEFQYVYHKALKVRRVKKGSGDDRIDGPQVKNQAKRIKLDKVEAEVGGSRSEPAEDLISSSQVSSSQPDLGDSPDRQLNISRKEKDANIQQYKVKLLEQQKLTTKKMEEYEARLKEMQRQLQEKETAEQDMQQKLEEEKKRRETQSKVVEDLKKKEEDLKQEFKAKQEALLKEKEEMEARMREELEDQLHCREAGLMECLETQKQTLLKEKQEVEKKLQKELATALEEKDKKLEEELLEQKKRLEKVIENKELEQKVLESQLKEASEEKDKKQEEILKAKEDVLANFADLMETELQCSICSELFVKATSLNCSHAFCSLCISQWMKLKMECPVCRAAITTQMRSIVLDSYIDRMVEQLSEEMKERRKQMIEDRKKEEEKFEEANRPSTSDEGRGRGRGRGGRARGRGRNRGRGGRQAAAAILSPQQPENPIMIESSENESDDEMYRSFSGSDTDSEDGLPGAYYGGYGRCYVCGAPGHWANGCPYR